MTSTAGATLVLPARVVSEKSRGTTSAESAVDSASPPVFRPVQYLGSKLRSAETIVAAIAELSPRTRAVADVFTGTTVVAQTAARAGYSVFASDVMESSASFARALLGIGRPGSNTSADALVEDLLESCDQDAMQAWISYISAEDAAIAAADGDALIRISKSIPQIWRPDGATAAALAQFEAASNAIGRTGYEGAQIATTHYAGTYFGMRQAAEIDQIRQAIERRRRAGAFSPWEHDVLLTAVLSAASECAFSAGKHFAQPHCLREDKDLAFARARIVEDRRRSVRELVRERVRLVWDLGRHAGPSHRASCCSIEDLSGTPARLAGIDTIYADPPYTAQQYSRFYHVLEVLSTYSVPRLQKVNEIHTRGLYPEDRFKSRFCSKRLAVSAFRDLCGLAISLKADLAISYSGTSSGETGNDRMIALSTLTALCRETFGLSRVVVTELGHRYRQFNQRLRAVDQRDDPEVLIFCRAQ